MSKKAFIHISQLRWNKYVGRFLYMVAAVLAIGQIFYASPPVGLAEAALVLIGVVFAALTLYSATPHLIKRSGSALSWPRKDASYTSGRSNQRTA